MNQPHPHAVIRFTLTTTIDEMTKEESDALLAWVLGASFGNVNPWPPLLEKYRKVFLDGAGVMHGTVLQLLQSIFASMA